MPDPADPVFLVDLDGTVLTASSFRIWCRMLLTGEASVGHRGRRVAVAAGTAVLLAARRLRLIGHARLRATLAGWWRWSTEADGVAVAALWAALDTRRRPELDALIASIASGERDAVLATAASAVYARGYAYHLGFRHVVASRGRVVADGVAKRDAVVALLETLSWSDRPLVLLTDGMEDAPLARLCALIHWFGDPDQADAFGVAAGGVPVTVGLQVPPAR
jgi:phosphoserine phosphatase